MATPNPALKRTITHLPRSAGEVVTLDGVVQKTAALLALLLAFASGTWLFLTPPTTELAAERVATVGTVAFVASIAALGLSFFISLARKPRVGAIWLFAALEGIVIGALSKFSTFQLGSNEAVVGAVSGTVVAFAATLAAYKFFNIQVTARMRRLVTIGVLSFVGIMLVDLGLYFFGLDLGLSGFGPMGILASFVGVGLAIFMLLVDFDAVEYAIEQGAPAEEGWRLAFGLTVALVWLYVHLLRLFTAFNQD